MIERQPFGRTGHQSSRLIFGAAALGRMRQDKADQVLQAVVDAGINHIDTARGYGDSELRLQPFLADHRDEFFLATKTGSRTADGARRELEESLARLGVDQVDLIQLHNLVEPEEFETAHSPGGAVEALVRAREEGLVRFIGVTGHGVRIPSMHMRSLERFPYDSVLLPHNFAMMRDIAYRSDTDALLERCAQQSVAVQTIKSAARRRWTADASGPRHAWYQPLTDAEAITRAVAYTLGNPQLFVNTSSDASLLPTLVAAAQGSHDRRSQPTDAAMEADLERLGIEPLFDGAELERI